MPLMVRDTVAVETFARLAICRMSMTHRHQMLSNVYSTWRAIVKRLYSVANAAVDEISNGTPSA
jgi:hypothetical protein